MSTLLFLLAFAPDASAGRVNNPGGERIPFVKLQSGVWDVVIRKTGKDRARIERVKAQCQGIWVNACASGVDPELRQIALGRVFQDDIALSGDFTYCSTALVSDLPEDLGRKLIRAGTESFCSVFLDPESVRGERSGNATDGENDLVGRLFGGKDTTSGKVMIKAPPTIDGEGSDRVVEASGERRRPGGTRRPTPSPQPAPAPARTADPSVDPDAYVMDDSGSTGSDETPPAPEPTTAGLSRPEPAERPAPAPVPAPEPLALEDETPVFVPPEPEPEPEPLDPELEALLAPIPQHESTGVLPAENGSRNAPAPEPTRPDPRDEPEPEPSTDFLSTESKGDGRMAAADVAVPAPAPQPRPAPKPPPEPIAKPKPAPEPDAPSEFELEAQEVANMERLSDVVDEEEDDKKRKKNRKKDKDDDDDDAGFIGGDEEFDNYIIIDIESLPEDE